MTRHYYFDIETYGRGKKPDPETDKVITIQFQEIDSLNGSPKGDLCLLKEWESNEEAILRRFASVFRPWDFVPVGNSLNFERRFLRAKCEKYGIGEILRHGDLAHDFPSIDIQPLFVILNKGEFRGCGMHNFTKKKCDGSQIAEWYEKKDYARIEDYIRDEADAFLEFYQRCYAEFPRIFLKDSQ